MSVQNVEPLPRYALANGLQGLPIRPPPARNQFDWKALLGRTFRHFQVRPPRQDLVVAHGDASLSNMIVGPDGRIGFIDCGHAGRADRYLDLAVAGAEIAELFGPERVRSFAKAYGLARWNARKVIYFADLYEFF